jgi:hypothetical protein
MSNFIYVMWRTAPQPNAYELSEEELHAAIRKQEESLASVGGETVIQLDTRWSNEKWQSAGVVKYPTLEALQKHTKNLEALAWFRYLKTETLLGSALLDTTADVSNPICVMWRLTIRPEGYALSPEVREQKFKARDQSMTRLGAKKVLQLDARWSNEKWQYAGIMTYHSLAALQKQTKTFEELSWYRYLETETLLGVEIDDA